jgi:hypothetical protein
MAECLDHEDAKTREEHEGRRSATDSFVLRALRPLRVFVIQTSFGAS